MAIDLVIDKRGINDIYIPFVTGKIEKPVKIFYGSRNSAKTREISHYLVIQCLTQKHFRYVLCREFGNSIKDSQWSSIKTVCDDYGYSKYFKFTKSPLEITCTLNGNKFLARGLDDAEKLKSIDDVTGIWFEECDRITYKTYETVVLSIRSNKVEFVEQIHSFNSTDKNSWYVSEFFPPLNSFEVENGKFHEVESIREDAYILHTTFRDNQFISDQQLENIKRIKNSRPSSFKVVGLGLFGQRNEGLIYPNWKIESEVPENANIIGYGLDFGYSNPSSLVRHYQYENQIYVQIVFHKEGLQVSDMLALMKGEVSKSDIIVADSASPDKIDEIEAAGYNIIKADKAVSEGIGTVKKFNIYILADSMQIEKERETYVWKTNRSGTVVYDEPVKLNDHSLDAIRYFLHKNFGGTDIKTGQAFKAYYSTFDSSIVSTFNVPFNLKRYICIKFIEGGQALSMLSYVDEEKKMLYHFKNYTGEVNIKGANVLVYYDREKADRGYKNRFYQRIDYLKRSNDFYLFEIVSLKGKQIKVKAEIDAIYENKHRYSVQINSQCKALIKDKKLVRTSEIGLKERGDFGEGDATDLEDILVAKLLGI